MIIHVCRTHFSAEMIFNKTDCIICDNAALRARVKKLEELNATLKSEKDAATTRMWELGKLADEQEAEIARLTPVMEAAENIITFELKGGILAVVSQVEDVVFYSRLPKGHPAWSKFVAAVEKARAK